MRKELITIPETISAQVAQARPLGATVPARLRGKGKPAGRSWMRFKPCHLNGPRRVLFLVDTVPVDNIYIYIYIYIRNQYIHIYIYIYISTAPCMRWGFTLRACLLLVSARVCTNMFVYSGSPGPRDHIIIHACRRMLKQRNQRLNQPKKTRASHVIRDSMVALVRPYTRVKLNTCLFLIPDLCFKFVFVSLMVLRAFLWHILFYQTISVAHFCCMFILYQITSVAHFRCTFSLPVPVAHFRCTLPSTILL